MKIDYFRMLCLAVVAAAFAVTSLAGDVVIFDDHFTPENDRREALHSNGGNLFTHK